MEGGKREDGDKPSYIHFQGGASHRGEGIQIQIQNANTNTYTLTNANTNSSANSNIYSLSREQMP